MFVNSSGQIEAIIESGTITTVSTVTAVTAITDAVTVVGNVAAGSAVSGDPVQVAGTDGTDVRGLKTDTSGRLYIQEPNNVLLATTAVSVTSTVTSESETAGVNGQCVVVSVSCVTAKTMAYPVAVRVRDTTNGIITGWQICPIQVAGGSASQLYFNLPVTNGDTVVIDLIAQGTVGSGSTNVTAVLSPLAVPTALRSDGRSLPLNTQGIQNTAGSGGTTLVAAVANWRPLVGMAFIAVFSTPAAGLAYVNATVGGGFTLCAMLSGAAYGSESAQWGQGLLGDADTVIAAVGPSAGATVEAGVSYDLVPV